MGFLQQLLLAGTLSISSGLRAFVPLVAICWAARSGLIEAKYLNPELYPYIAKNDTVFYLVVMFAVIEVLGDKVTSANSFLDAIHLVVKPISGIAACLAVLNHPDTIVNFVIALGFGAGITLPVQSFRTSCKILSSSINYGNFNLCLSFTEDILSLGMINAEELIPFPSPCLSFTEDILSLGGTVLGLVDSRVALPVSGILVYFSLSAFRKWKYRVLSGEEEEDISPQRMRDDAEILEIKRLKRLKKRKR